MSYSNTLFQVGKLLSAGTLAIAITTSVPEAAQAFNFTSVVAFGDSLSDNRNFYQTTLGFLPPSPPYAAGRFSNGPVWVEYLAQDLQVPLINYAFGGATSGNINAAEDDIPAALQPFVPPLPGLQQEINSFVSLTPMADPNALYTVWAGANDYLGADVTDPFIPVANIRQAVQTLAGAGAKTILIPNLPDLGQLPATRLSAASQPLSQLTIAHNTLLANALTLLKPTLAPDVNLLLLDVNTLVNQAISNPSSLGFTNATDSCLSLSPFSLCSNPDQYVFWDDIHPTTAAHRQVAGLALSTVQAEAIPEPTTVTGLIVSGLLMGTLKARKKHRSKLAKSDEQAA